MMANVKTNSTHKSDKSSMTFEANATVFAAEVEIVSPKGKDSVFSTKFKK